MFTAGIGTLLSGYFLLPNSNAVLELMTAEKPLLFITVVHFYQAMPSRPFIGCSVLFSLLYVFLLFSIKRSGGDTTTAVLAGRGKVPPLFWWSGNCTIRSGLNRSSNRAG